jgi:DNA mismatch repair ATPase MutS
MEAGEKLKEQCRNIQFRYLPATLEGNKPVYTYVLKDGITDDRQGMIIIQNEGILDILIGKKETVNNEFCN